MSPDRLPETSPSADGPEALAGIANVSRETVDRLKAYVALLRKWQPAENLISSATLPLIWKRHIADSAQLVALLPAAKTWVDLGAGAGLPGIVIACLLADQPGAAVHLVESNSRKCAFLRRAIAETGAPAVVHNQRIESFTEVWSAPVEAVTARALASLSLLLAFSRPLMEAGATGLFPKGRDYQREIAEASQSWEFDLLLHQSRVEPDGVILQIDRLRRKLTAKAAQP